MPSTNIILAASAIGLGLTASCLAGPAAHPARAVRTSQSVPLRGKTDLFLAQTLAARPRSGWSSVIARLDGGLTPVRQAQFRSLQASLSRRLPLIGSVALRIPSRNLAKLAAFPFVVHLSSDGVVKKCDEFTLGSSGAGAAYQQFGLTGKGITVAVVDSGIVGHHDLDTVGPDTLPSSTPSRILSEEGFTSDGQTDDLCGHGTHVAGIIAGNGNDSTAGDAAGGTGGGFSRTFYGVARQANLVSVRVLDSQGQGTVSSVVSGIQWVVQNKATYNIRVMNLSLGHPVGESCTTDPLCQAVEAAWKAGIVVVCAAGNNGRLNATQTALDNEGWGTAYGSIETPGNDPYVITVGATKSTDSNRANDRIATYSGRGPTRLDLVLKPDIIAPGNKVISLNTVDDNQGCYLGKYESTNGLPWSAYENQPAAGNGNNSTTYFVLSGTSMATPVVSGAAALLLQNDSTLSPDTIKARLMVSADKWTDPNGNGDPCTYGAGYLNILSALQSTLVATQAALSPNLTADANGNVNINMSHVIWGTGLTDLHAIWGTHVIWGTNTLSASHVIWGTSVWNDHVIWGTSTSAVDLSSVALNGEGIPANWAAVAVSVGLDNRTHLNWVTPSGKLALWSVTDATGAFTQNVYGPYPNWSATALSMGVDGNTRVLWNCTDGTAALWSVNNASSAFSQNVYGPYAGWTAKTIAAGTDGKTRVLWCKTDGTATLWSVNETTGAFTQNVYGPYPNWSATALSVGADGRTRVLWNATDGTAALWSVNETTGAFTQFVYGPYVGWTAKTIAAGTDGKTRAIWSRTDGALALWDIDSGNGAFTQNVYGPY